MAKPCLAASARDDFENPAIAFANFGIGVQVHNRNTKEDGLVRRCTKGTQSEIMYEVTVPAGPDTWAGLHYVSDWTEGNLSLSDSATLKTVNRPTGSTPRVDVLMPASPRRIRHQIN